MPKEILEEQGQLHQSGSSSFASTPQLPPRKPSPPLPSASMVEQQREQEASPSLSFRKPSSSLFERETETLPSPPPTVPAPSFWSAKQGIPGTKPPVPTKPLVPNTTKPSYTPPSSSIPTTTPSLPNRPSQTSGTTTAPAPSLPNRPPHTPSHPQQQQQQQQQPSVATKPAYLNTSYTPRKVNINIQNDTCTKCGKAVYAAELVSFILFYI